MSSLVGSLLTYKYLTKIERTVMNKQPSLNGLFIKIQRKKSFKRLTLGVNVINFFPSLLMTRPNKLECLYLAITYQSNLTFAGNTKSLPKKEASERCSNWAGSGFALKY